MADNTAANLRQPKTHEEAIGDIQAKIAEKNLDSFKIKIHRKAGLGAQVVHVASLEEATLAMLASPEQWVPMLAGGGPIYLITVTAADEHIPFTNFQLANLIGAEKKVSSNTLKDPNWKGPTVLTYPNPEPVKSEGIDSIRELNNIRNVFGVPAPTTETSGSRGQDNKGQGGDSGLSEVQRRLDMAQLAGAFKDALTESQRSTERQLAEMREMVKALATQPQRPQKSIGEILAEATPLITAVGAIIAPLISTGRTEKIETEKLRAAEAAAQREREAKMNEQMMAMLSQTAEKAGNSTSEMMKIVGPVVDSMSMMGKTMLQQIATMKELSAGEPPEEGLGSILRTIAGAAGEYMAAKASAMPPPQQRQLPAPRPPPAPAAPSGQPSPEEATGEEHEATSQDEQAAQDEYLRTADAEDVLARTTEAIKAQVAPAELAPAFVRAITLNPGVAQAVQTAGGPLPLFRARIADDGWLKAHMQYVAALVQQLNVAMRSPQPQQ